jgi:hypothetical protein
MSTPNPVDYQPPRRRPPGSFLFGILLGFAAIMAIGAPLGMKQWASGAVPRFVGVIFFIAALLAMIIAISAFRSRPSQRLLAGLLTGACLAALLNGFCFFGSVVA